MQICESVVLLPQLETKGTAMKSKIFLTSLALVLTVAVTAFPREIKKEFKESFKVREGVTLYLKHDDGDVVIRTWTRDVIDVDISYRASVTSIGSDDEYDFNVEFKQTDDGIYVTGQESAPRSGIRNRRIHEYIYEIRVPVYADLNIDGDDGDVVISDSEGQIVIDLEDGDLELENVDSEHIRIRLEDGDMSMTKCEGDIDIEAEDGDILLKACTGVTLGVRVEDGDIGIVDTQGDVDIRAEDGDVKLENIRTEKVVLRTADGDIVIDGLKSDELDLDIETQDGDVRISVEKGLSAAYRVETDDGTLRVSLPNAEKDRNGEWVKGEMNGGKGSLHIKTEDGDVFLRESR